MPDRRTPKHIHEAVGGFMVVMLLVLTVFATRAAFLHHWFSARRTLNVLMPVEGSFGLREGSEVVVLGTRAGFVERISIGEDMRMRAIVAIREDFAPFVKSRSEVIIRKTFGIAGETYLAVRGSAGYELDWEEATLVAAPDRTTTERMDEVLEKIGGKLLPAIDQFRQGIERWAEVADYLRDPDRDFGPLLIELRQIAGRLNSGQGTLGRLLVDDQMALDVEEILSNARQVAGDASAVSGLLREEVEALPGMVSRMQDLLIDLQVIAADLRENGPAAIDGVRDAATRLPGLILQAQETVRQIEALAEALRERFAPGSQPASRDRRVRPEDAVP